ncbi:MAG: hypothetical protein AAF480_17720 [Actinomycetota bacterium]
MEVEPDDEFEEPAMGWLFREVTRLAATLRRSGIPEERIRAVCHEYIGGMAYGIDSEPVEVKGVSYEIAVVATDPDGRSVMATDLFLFHETANSIVDQVLDPA